MGKTRAPYPAAFRQQLIELVEAGRTPTALAREFGVTAQTIANWVGQAAIAKQAVAWQEGLTRPSQEYIRLARKPGVDARHSETAFAACRDPGGRNTRRL